MIYYPLPLTGIRLPDRARAAGINHRQPLRIAYVLFKYGRRINVPSTFKKRVRTGTCPDWTVVASFFFLTVATWNGKQQRHLLLLPQRKHNRKCCNSVQICTFAWKTVSVSAPGVCVVVSARILQVRAEYHIPVPIAGTGTGASLCVSIPWECRVCAAQPKSCDQRGITWCTADKRREVGNWRELWKDMVGGCVQGRQQRGSLSCCSSLRGWHLANGWVPTHPSTEK